MATATSRTRKPAAKPAVTTEAEVTAKRDSDRDVQMREAYQSAIATLKANHNDEWNALLNEEYAKRDLDVRRRLTEEERQARAAAKIEERRQALLAKLAELGGDPRTTPLYAVGEDVTADPFAS